MTISQAIKMMSQVTGKSRKSIKDDFEPIIEAFEEIGSNTFAKSFPMEFINFYLYGSELSNKSNYFNSLDVRNFLIKEFNLRGQQADVIISSSGKVDNWLLFKLAAYRILDEEYPEDEYNTLKTVIDYYVNREKEQKEKYFNEYKKAITSWKAQEKGLKQLLDKATKGYDKTKMYGPNRQEIIIIETKIINLIERVKELNECFTLSNQSMNSAYPTVIP
jgi:hypothetical protein